MALDCITPCKYYVKRGTTGELFDQMIVPVLLYGSEIWDSHNIEQM